MDIADGNNICVLVCMHVGVICNVLLLYAKEAKKRSEASERGASKQSSASTDNLYEKT